MSAAAASAAEALRVLGDAEITAAPPVPIPFGDAALPATSAFGAHLGFDAIAWAYAQHMAAVQGYLVELRESTYATAEALKAVADLYRRADEAAAGR
ncbi:hypothetical protein [Saccharopolyspora hordei]|uniref:PE domain-containing protein n=1 Tax=Saccharopolyspora hordei TaxID=1838 RepID=A0A853AK14_9PSEU|nr:hypothetical protein [Saccharopolyspora hordei]NYI82593.1 hypothetical protein [Saccharopolyspora hordei]